MNRRPERLEHLAYTTCDIFAKRLKEAIEDAETNKSEMERDGVCGRDSIRTYMNESKMPNGRTLLYICNYLNVSADWLLGFTNEKRAIWS